MVRTETTDRAYMMNTQLQTHPTVIPPVQRDTSKAGVPRAAPVGQLSGESKVLKKAPLQVYVPSGSVPPT